MRHAQEALSAAARMLVVDVWTGALGDPAGALKWLAVGSVAVMTTESRRELMREVNERKLADEAAAVDKQRAEAQAAEAAASAAAAPAPASFRDLLASTPSWDGSKVAVREAEAVPARPAEHAARPRSMTTSLRNLIQCVLHAYVLCLVCAADSHVLPVGRAALPHAPTQRLRSSTSSPAWARCTSWSTSVARCVREYSARGWRLRGSGENVSRTSCTQKTESVKLCSLLALRRGVASSRRAATLLRRVRSRPAPLRSLDRPLCSLLRLPRPLDGRRAERPGSKDFGHQVRLPFSFTQRRYEAACKPGSRHWLNRRVPVCAARRVQRRAATGGAEDVAGARQTRSGRAGSARAAVGVVRVLVAVDGRAAESQLHEDPFARHLFHEVHALARAHALPAGGHELSSRVFLAAAVELLAAIERHLVGVPGARHAGAPVNLFYVAHGERAACVVTG